MTYNEVTSKWWFPGLRFALWMFFCMVIVIPLILGEGLRWSRVIIGIPIWTMAGLAYAYYLKSKIKDIDE